MITFYKRYKCNNSLMTKLKSITLYAYAVPPIITVKLNAATASIDFFVKCIIDSCLILKVYSN